jgi:uncharacterized protein (DUF1800 family)
MAHKPKIIFHFALAFFSLGGATSAWALDFPATTMTREQMVQHLLNRAAFGARPEELQSLAQPGALEHWFERQLYPQKISDASLVRKLSKMPIYGLSTAELLKKIPPTPYNEGKRLLIESMANKIRYQKLIMATESKREFEQVLVDFWFNHLDVDASYPWMLPSYEDSVIRAHVFGKFKDMLLASARHPMMLQFLDNLSNSVKNPAPPKDLRPEDHPDIPGNGINENYAREILELHTVGISGGYDQKDVEAVARIFTGWTIATRLTAPHFVYIPNRHDQSDVVVMGHPFFGKDEAAEGEKFIDYISMAPATARFISSKLCRHFVSDPAPDDCTRLLSQRYLATGGDLREVYKTLFLSRGFWDRQVYRQRIKKPFEFAVSALRSIGSDIQIDDTRIDSFASIMYSAGEFLYDCPGPAGFSDENANWAVSSSVMNRILSAQALIEIGKPALKISSQKIKSVAESATGLALTESAESDLRKIIDAKKDNQGNREGEDQVLAMILASPDFQRR